MLQGQTTVVHLNDVTGWADAGTLGYQRTFAVYGYSNSDGYTYPDYTYTRRLVYAYSAGAWDIGSVDTVNNTITLRNPWPFADVPAGTATRNTTSGGTYNYAPLAYGHVPNDWTKYTTTISGVAENGGYDPNSFRPGTAYIKPVMLFNRHGSDGNLITWKDVEIERVDQTFHAGDNVDLHLPEVVLPGQGVTYQWTQLEGPSVTLNDANTSTAHFTAPDHLQDYQVSFQVDISDGTQVVTKQIDVTILVGADYDAMLDPVALQDASTFSGLPNTSKATKYGAGFTDDYTPVDLNSTYTLSGWGRSGDDNGDQYQSSNRQYFGFASYDSDQNLILPQHNLKFSGAADTYLTQPLTQGQTTVVHLNDVTGWADAGTHNVYRALAVYGYTNSDGYTYPDYTYTQHVVYNSSQGAWDIGSVDTVNNTITLRNPWPFSDVPAGTAARNAIGGGVYNYAALSYGHVPNTWTEYTATISGIAENGVPGAKKFRPGTAYIKPIVLYNYHGSDGNLITWKDVEIERVDQTFHAGDNVDLHLPEVVLPGQSVTYQWTQLEGPSVTLNDANSATANFIAPDHPHNYRAVFQVDISDGTQTVTREITLNIAPSNPNVLHVTNTVDGAPGSLRDAIILANTMTDPVTIELPAGTYPLTKAGSGEDGGLTGDLDITGDITIVGPGADETVIDAGGSTGLNDRIFDVLPGASLNLSGVTMSGGYVNAHGGAIEVEGGTLQIVDSSIVNNTGVNGGAIRGRANGTVNIIRSTIANNTATSWGGGINIVDATLNIDSSTISGNSATGGEGGGMWLSSGAATISHSTISHNDVPTGRRGAGISFRYADLEIDHTIIANNQAIGDPPTADYTDLARNAIGTGVLTTFDYNLLGVSTIGTSLPSTAEGNLFDVDPQLGPLQDNGGPTLTHALSLGSPAIDAGRLTLLEKASDQRGMDRLFDGDGSGYDVIDMGAYEYAPAPSGEQGEGEPDPSLATVGLMFSLEKINEPPTDSNISTQLTLDADSYDGPLYVTLDFSGGSAIHNRDFQVKDASGQTLDETSGRCL